MGNAHNHYSESRPSARTTSLRIFPSILPQQVWRRSFPRTKSAKADDKDDLHVKTKGLRRMKLKYGHGGLDNGL
jgi:hypothetical protein